MKVKKNKKIFYKIIAEQILKTRTFDVKDNIYRFKKVYELIARDMCDDLFLADFVSVFHDTCKMVRRNLNHAISYLEDERGYPIYRMLENKKKSDKGDITGGKFLEYLTLEPGYRDAPVAEIDRITNLLNKSINSTTRNLKIKSPKTDPNVFILNTIKKIANEKEKETKIITHEEEKEISILRRRKIN